MQRSSIHIDIQLDEQKVPARIDWEATDNRNGQPDQARALVLSLWDPQQRSALRIDLWTKEMKVDEMGDFFYQIFLTMSDTFLRATRDQESADEIRNFSEEFIRRFREKLNKT